LTRGEGLVDLAPRLRRRATLIARHVPRGLREALECDAALVRTGTSAASAYGWAELAQKGATWSLDAYLPLAAFAGLQERLNRLDIDDDVGVADDAPDSVMLRVVGEPWPFPPHYPLAPQPLAALDLLDHPDPVARRIAGEVLSSLGETKPAVLARRSARARASTGPLTGRLLESSLRRGPRVLVEGDPKTDMRAAAAHIVGVLWAAASQGVTVRELRAAIGLSRERLEDAYEFLLANPPSGLALQRHADELRLVTALRWPRRSSGAWAIHARWRCRGRRWRCWPLSPTGNRLRAPASNSFAVLPATVRSIRSWNAASSRTTRISLS